jgi:hypothetical protein
MIQVDPSGEVEFEFFRPGVRQVFLAGDFNGWSTRLLPMRRTGGGYWRHRLRLPPGSHEFKYVADGEWHVDDGATGVKRGGLGEWNSVVLVHPADEKPRSNCPRPRGTHPSNTIAPETVAVLPTRADPWVEVEEVQSGGLLASSPAAFW